MKRKLEVIARALIEKDGKILLCKRKDRDYYFLPGGHVEIGETSKEALIREIKEERGSELKNVFFIGIVENAYKEELEEHYEINIIHQAEEENENEETVSKEDHLLFCFVARDDLKKCNIQPLVLKEKIMEYLSKKEVFWGSSKLNKQ